MVGVETNKEICLTGSRDVERGGGLGVWTGSENDIYVISIAWRVSVYICVRGVCRDPSYRAERLSASTEPGEKETFLINKIFNYIIDV